MNDAPCKPLVSVVMGVHNGAAHLQDTVKSILGQTDVALEFIVVNDGSTDQTAEILAQLAAQDGRLRVLDQRPRAGLTRALILGCSQAHGKYIARQDCGDRSHPQRLKKELAVFDLTADAALVSCGVHYMGPEGEFLYDAILTGRQAATGLRTEDPAAVHGPAHHGSTMFRRDWYEQVGGYRKEFYFSQDLDLWTRLAERGPHVALPDILYEATFAINSISGLYRKRQVESTKLILACGQLRKAGRSEAEPLAQATSIRPSGLTPARSDVSRALYFVGSCLRKQRDSRARRYFQQAFATYPLHLKALARWLVG